jgi:hypothetical protein
MHVVIRRTSRAIPVAIVLFLALSWPGSTLARQADAEKPHDPEELARQLSNSVSALVSVPFQFNWEERVGPFEQARFVLNLQPVMPIALNQEWNLIARLIVPLISQPPLFDGGSPAFGVGDALTSFFFSPAHGGLI